MLFYSVNEFAKKQISAGEVNNRIAEAAAFFKIVCVFLAKYESVPQRVIRVYEKFMSAGDIS